MYKVEYSPQATKQLRKLDPSIARNIYSWIGKISKAAPILAFTGKALPPTVVASIAIFDQVTIHYHTNDPKSLQTTDRPRSFQQYNRESP